MSRPYLRHTVVGAVALLSAACGKEAPQLTPEQQINRDFAKLTWTLMEPLKSSEECRKIGTALAAWEKENGARHRELAAKITTLRGADADNFGKVEHYFKQLSYDCIHPKGGDKLPLPMREHDANFERVFKLFPKLSTRYELR